MKAAYLTEIGHVEIHEFERPTLSEHEVLIQVKVAGICGSDIHAFHGRHPFRKPPMILGHEVAGEIVEIGSGVTQVCVGDRVTVEPQKVCERCAYCKKGLYNLCESKIMAGVGGWLGSFADYFLAPEKRVYVLPDSMEYDVGLLAEPLAVGVHGVRIAELESGFNAIVLGTGPIGLLAAVAAQEAGAEQVFCTDLNRFRLKMAESFGMHPIQVEEGSLEETVRAHTQEGCDLAILTVSSPQAVDQALRAVRRGGKVIVISVFDSPIPVDLGLVQQNEIEVKGSTVYTRDDFLQALQILQRREKDLKQVVTHHKRLDQVNEAIHMLDHLQSEALKIAVQP